MIYDLSVVWCEVADGRSTSRVATRHHADGARCNGNPGYLGTHKNPLAPPQRLDRAENVMEGSRAILDALWPILAKQALTAGEPRQSQGFG